MQVKTYTAAQLQLRSTKETSSSVASIATETRDFNVTIPPDSVVTRAVLSVTVSGTGAYGSNMKQCNVNGEEVRSGASGADLINEMRVEINTSRQVSILFRYQMSQYVSGTQFTVTFKDIVLTIEYEYSEDADTGYTDNEVLIPSKGVRLFAPKATSFDGGIVLHPTSCTVTEEAGGEYELEMEHPKDPEGRWQSLLEDYLIDAPVPPFKIPDVVMPVGSVYRVKSGVTSTALYSRLPTYSKASADGKQASGTTYAQWSASVEYTPGMACWYESSGEKTVYVSGGTNLGNASRPDIGGIWAILGPLNPTSADTGTGTGTYDPGVIIRDIPAGETLSFIATYNWKYTQVRDSLGNTGYTLTANIEQTDTAPEPYTIPGKKVYRQLFRIYAVSCDEASGLLTVNARHISYDLDANALFDCKLTEAEPATALALMQGRLMNDDTLQYKTGDKRRIIACPIEAPKINADWSFGNPIQALLDPDDGFAAQLRGNVLRDNGDFYILPNDTPRIGAQLAYGVNLRGVTWERNTEDLVTRIIPRAGNGNNGYIYLDELFLDSGHIEDYAVIHTEVLDSKYSVGQTIETADGSTRKLSKSEVIERMRQEAENRYYVDGADKVTVSLDVDFILLGDTEEYRQYRNLQRVSLYDRVSINTGSTEVSAQVIGYEWDCLLGRYNGISIGKVYSQSRRIPGYRVATGAITYSKLSPGLITWIKGAE